MDALTKLKSEKKKNYQEKKLMTDFLKHLEWGGDLLGPTRNERKNRMED